MDIVGALATSLNPTLTTIKNTQCAACHVSTMLLASRLDAGVIDPMSVPNQFTSTHDLSIAAGQSATDNTSLRAFGWRDAVPEISQRVVNETAMVLDEIEARFPPAP